MKYYIENILTGYQYNISLLLYSEFIMFKKYNRTKNPPDNFNIIFYNSYLFNLMYQIYCIEKLLDGFLISVIFLI